jgi:hypothetical protein
MSNRKWFKRKTTGSIFKTIHVGENYVFGTLFGKPDVLGYTASLNFREIEWCDDPTEIKVGDYVRPKTSTMSVWFKVIHIHQEPGDDRKWVVYAFEGDIPQAKFASDLFKKVD